MKQCPKHTKQTKQVVNNHPIQSNHCTVLLREVHIKRGGGVSLNNRSQLYMMHHKYLTVAIKDILIVFECKSYK